MTVSYEWIVELVTNDSHEDIIDTDHFTAAMDALEHMRKHPAPEGHRYDFGMTRETGNDDEGMTGRSWAYYADGKLPDAFTDGDANAAVPQRYREELTRALHIYSRIGARFPADRR